MTDEGLLDEAYERLRDTGPEFDGWLSNHGPMAADALLRLGRGDAVHRWLDGYLPRLQEAPSARWRLDADEWPDVLGDPSRLGDWRVLLAQEVREEPWQQVLLRWWPRLLPGAAASAAHGLIRTGHVVRALREQDTGPRRHELAEALAYWAARWLPVPAVSGGGGALAPSPALEGLPAVPKQGGFRAQLRLVGAEAAWPAAAAAVRLETDPTAVPAALDDLVDAAVQHYERWGHASPVMLVHAATAPRAVSLVLPSLPRELWPASLRAAWAVSAAVASAYRPAPGDAAAPRDREHDWGHDLQDAVDRAVALGDEHAVKFAETASGSHRRGSSGAAAAVHRAVDLIREE